MMKLDGTHRVEIRHDGYTQVSVDGVRLKRVREIAFHESVDEAPTITIDIVGRPTLNMDAFVEIEFSADEYLAWMDKEIEKAEGDVKYKLKECRAEYIRVLGCDA